MKTKILIIITFLMVMNSSTVSAQIRFSFNIGLQPLWGPVGYDRVENYYLPEIDAYYNVDSRQYTYIVNGRWVNTGSLPWRYRNYDLYSGYKVVMNEPRPYLHYNRDREQYASYRNRHDQQPIRDSRDQKYFENQYHPQHNEWKGNEYQKQRDQQHNRKDKGREKDRD
jgi:hypothetical protein